MPNEISLQELRSLKTEGSRGVEDLCKLAEILGYKNVPNQLQCNNGAYVSSLLAFFEDNPGVMIAIHRWVEENYVEYSSEDSKGCPDCLCSPCDCLPEG